MSGASIFDLNVNIQTFLDNISIIVRKYLVLLLMDKLSIHEMNELYLEILMPFEDLLCEI